VSLVSASDVVTVLPGMYPLTFLALFPATVTLSIALAPGALTFGRAGVIAGAILVLVLFSLEPASDLFDKVVGPYLRGLAWQRSRHVRGPAPWMARSALALLGLLAAVLLYGGLTVSLSRYPAVTLCLAIVAFLLCSYASLTHEPWFALAVGGLLLAPPVLVACALRRAVERMPSRIPPPERPEAGSSVARTLRIAHLSDLHLLPDGEGIAAEGNVIRPQARLETVLNQLSCSPPDLVVTTGDITDRADADSWMRFGDFARRLAHSGSGVAFVPGNHDLNIVSTSDFLPRRGEGPVASALRRVRFLPVEENERVAQRSRMLRSALALSQLSSGPLMVYQCDGPPLPLERLLTRHAAQIEAFRRGQLVRTFETYDPERRDPERDEYGHVPAWQGDFAGWVPSERETTPEAVRDALGVPERIWDEMWPAVALDAKRGLILHHLNSCRLSSAVATNAFGVLGSEQVRRSVELHRWARRELPTGATVILLHHSPAPAPVTLRAGLTNPFLSIADADALLTAFEGEHPLILSGHTHQEAIQRLPGPRGVATWCVASSLGHSDTSIARIYDVELTATGHVASVTAVDISPDEVLSPSGSLSREGLLRSVDARFRPEVRPS
jgi:predicted phosphodiesterase